MKKPSLPLFLGGIPVLTGAFLLASALVPQTEYVPLASVARADTGTAPAGGAAPATEGEKLPPEELAEKAFKVLETNCISCHGTGKRMSRRLLVDRKGYKTLLETRRALVPGNPDRSQVYTCLVDPAEIMPPRGVQPRPSQADIALIRTWITEGAPAWKEEAPAPPA